MRKEGLVGIAGVAVIVIASQFLLLAPQSNASQALDDEVVALEAANAQTALQVPALKAELATISGQVEALRKLSAQVPAELALPELYDELAEAAAIAGLPGGAQDVTVTAPTIVVPDAAAPAPTPAATATDTATDTAATPAPVTQAPSTAVIASFDVSMTVKGATGQVIAFLQALKSANRLSVVATSSLAVDTSGVASLQIRATYFLQQVDVAGLVTQIEALTAAAAGSESGSAPAVTPAPGASAIPPVSGTDPASIPIAPPAG
jgi:hypothetical protein